MKRKIACIIAGVLCACGIAGCGSADVGSVSETDALFQKAEANASPYLEKVPQATEEDKVELEAWVFFDENTPGTHYLDMWEELGEEYGYDITVKAYAEEQIRDKIKIAAACDELPDIFAVWGGNYANFLIDAGDCLDVGEYLKNADFTYKDSYIQPYKDGNNYIIPCLVEAYAVTYANNSLMQRIGLTMPQTWDELLAFVDKVNAYNVENGTHYAAIEMGDKDNWLGELLYDMVVNRIDPYAFDKLESGEIDLTDEVFLEAADKIKQLVERDAFNSDYMETGEVEAIQNFIDGDAVLFPHQSTLVYHLMAHMGEDTISFEQFPCCADTYDPEYASYLVDINHSLTPGVCISKDSKYADEAAKFCLKFAQEVNQINVTQYGYLNMFEGTEYDVPNQVAAPVQQFQDSINGAQKMTPIWYALMDPETGDNWRNLTKKLMANAITPENFVQEGTAYFQ